MFKPKPEKFSDIYRELSSLIGIENTIIIYEQYKGQQVSFPSKLHTSEYIKNCIIEEYNGKNIKALAQKYGYTERWVREVIAENKKEKSNNLITGGKK